MSYYEKIMSLQSEVISFASDEDRHFYFKGYRDGRHAAAELAAQADETIRCQQLVLDQIAEMLGVEKGDVDGIGVAIKGLKQGLSVAGRALVIADRGLVHVQCEPPLHWGLDAGDEDAEEGWCTTWALAKYIEALAAGEAE